jgi:hypothetical protein
VITDQSIVKLLSFTGNVPFAVSVNVSAVGHTDAPVLVTRMKNGVPAVTGVVESLKRSVPVFVAALPAVAEAKHSLMLPHVVCKIISGVQPPLTFVIVIEVAVKPAAGLKEKARSSDALLVNTQYFYTKLVPVHRFVVAVALEMGAAVELPQTCANRLPLTPSPATHASAKRDTFAIFILLLINYGPKKSRKRLRADERLATRIERVDRQRLVQRKPLRGGTESESNQVHATPLAVVDAGDDGIGGRLRG